MDPTKSTRRSPRRQLVLEVNWSVGERSGVDYVTNLSDHGMFLATTESLHVGEKLLLVINGPRGLHIEVAESVVRWRLESSFATGAGVGIEFTRITDAALQQIRELNREPAAD